MPVLSPPKAPSTLADPLAARVASLEQRLAALEAVITASPGGNVAIVAPGALRLQVGTALSISVGSDLSVTSARGVSVSAGHNLTVTAGGATTFMSGSATFTMRPTGEVEIAGSKIGIRGSGDVVLKGSRIIQN
jgi:type VI secretion system secreted protein VgrG